MKSTGIVRKVDGLGRIVIPKELRQKLDINEKDPVEIFVKGEQFILQKYVNSMACVVTDEITEDNKLFANGSIVLSPEGAELLREELETKRKSPEQS